MRGGFARTPMIVLAPLAISQPGMGSIAQEAAAEASSEIKVDARRKTAELRDGSGRLQIRLSYGAGCAIDWMSVDGEPVIRADGGVNAGWTGAESAIQIGGEWVRSQGSALPVRATRSGNRLSISGIAYGAKGMTVVESWTFTVGREGILWKIDREYGAAGTIEATAMPRLTFAKMESWKGALLGTGGVAWGKLLDAPNATDGVHTDSADLWNPDTDSLLRISSKAPGAGIGMRFTREADNRFTVASAVTAEALVPKYDLARFQRGRQDIWRGFRVRAGERVTTTIELRAGSYRSAYGRGEFKGLDTAAITELANTIGRIGVIDRDLVGSNGWYSGYICMHEPWLARVGSALNDPRYTASVARFLDYAREHAISADGMVKSRWKYDAGDAQPGTYDPANGFYEAQWGRLMDSQSSYATNVADQFDASGDLEWLKRQRSAAESALAYLLRRDSDADGLVEMENSLTGQRRSSDWLDIVWASHENAFVNAQLYGALRKWARIERILGDATKARRYSMFADRLKASFNRPIAEGGFWNPEKGHYVYWRDADGSIHGDNLVVPVNLTAIAEGLCEGANRERLLATIERRMEAESLLTWPSCFDSYAPGEGADDIFPKYENGDIFLAWAEYGIRAYAPTQPAIALKHLRRIVEQYRKDGLAYQRYLRRTGEGAGDDILANNCNALTGLYRDIYGLQPQWDRLRIDPHLSPELNGTRIAYDFRGTPLMVSLSQGAYAVSSGHWRVRSGAAFGFAPVGSAAGSAGVSVFADGGESPLFTVVGQPKSDVELSVRAWGRHSRVSLTSAAATDLEFRFPSLAAGRGYSVVVDGKRIGRVSGESRAVKVRVPTGRSVELSLTAQ